MEVDRSEIVFFDVETNVPIRKGQKFVLLEFGAILVCPRTLVELKEYSTLIQPADLSVITEVSIKCNGITRGSVSTQRRFEEIADKVYDLLHGRVWAGHNITRFDCPRIREAFAEIGRPAPEAKGIIDSLCLLQAKFGRRAGNLKMATLAEYFGLGIQKHRSLDDVRMNLEVVKYCATVLFLEEAQTSSTPVKTNSPSVPASSNCGQGSALVETPEEKDQKTLSKKKTLSNRSAKKKLNDNVKETGEAKDADFKAQNSNVKKDCFDLTMLDILPSICAKQEALEDENVCILSDPTNFASVSGTEKSGSADSDCFLEPREVNKSSLKPAFVPSQWGIEKMTLLHGKVPLQLSSEKLKIRYGISKKFLIPTGKPKLNFVVEPSQETCDILKICDRLAYNLYSECNGNSEWRPLVTTKNGLVNSSQTIRMHIATKGAGETATYCTDLYERDSAGTKKLSLTNVHIDELDKVFVYGRSVDAHFSFDIYDYKQNAGIRLVAKRLTVGISL
ncbi:hypothetical protein SUGI_1088050 [Cryptomeria japonica]|uniref:protein NEN1 n=1 Tax=Cryptomeria japonica TaxID=3369 RepID=UPI0024147639|nr:protein NEN1 [Cryptomeria japonica]GLJ51108.1 hypothetical protein SUGI_1088050 [Cryptomeria japonica]